jgi:hypothetical protein
MRNFRTLAVAGWALCSVAASQAGGLVLWNKLGSDEEVLHSAVGADGTVVGTAYAYEPGKFGNGYVRKAAGDNYVEFPASVADRLRRQGAIEEWINPKTPHPQPFSHGVYGLVGTPYGWAFLPSHASDGGVVLGWGDGVTFGGGFGAQIKFDGHVAQAIEATSFTATPGKPFHVAVAWDIGGIDGTADTIRIYRDGALVARGAQAWNPAGPEVESIVLGYGPDGGGYDRYIVDNLKIWDYAKVDYGDRFIESAGVVPEPASAALWAAGLAVLAGAARARRGHRPDADAEAA